MPANKSTLTHTSNGVFGAFTILDLTEKILYTSYVPGMLGQSTAKHGKLVIQVSVISGMDRTPGKQAGRNHHRGRRRIRVVVPWCAQAPPGRPDIQ